MSVCDYIYFELGVREERRMKTIVPMLSITLWQTLADRRTVAPLRIPLSRTKQVKHGLMAWSWSTLYYS